MEDRHDPLPADLPITTLGRPLDPSYGTNRAVLALMPLAAVVAGFAAWRGGAGAGSILLEAGGGALAALLGWAIAREIAPDDELVGAFLALALGVGAFVALDAALLPAAAALLFARLVCRSTGRAATVLDSFAVVVVALLAAWRAGSPWPAVAGGVAFGLDAVLRPGLARQWLFAGLCVAGGVALAASGLAPRIVPVQPGLVARSVATAILVGGIALVATTRGVTAKGDLTGEPLSPTRVRAAQAVALITALAVAATGSAGIERGAVVWAAIVGVVLPAAWRGLTGRR